MEPEYSLQRLLFQSLLNIFFILLQVISRILCLAFLIVIILILVLQGVLELTRQNSHQVFIIQWETTRKRRQKITAEIDNSAVGSGEMQMSVLSRSLILTSFPFPYRVNWLRCAILSNKWVMKSRVKQWKNWWMKSKIDRSDLSFLLFEGNSRSYLDPIL